MPESPDITSVFAQFCFLLVLTTAGVIVAFQVSKLEQSDIKTAKLWGMRLLWTSLASLIIVFMPWDAIVPERLMPVVDRYVAILTVVLSVTLAVSFALLSVYHSSGAWYSVYSRFRGLGIEDADPNRRGRTIEMTDKWMKEISKAKKRIVLSGVTLGGWFIVSWDDFKHALETILPRLESFEVFLLDPAGHGFEMRDRDESAAGERDPVRSRMKSVLEKIVQLLEDPAIAPHIQRGCLKFRLYTGTPLSLVLIDERIYYTTYLPNVKDSECPQILINTRGTFADQILRALEGVHGNSKKLDSVESVREIITSLDRVESANAT